MEDNGVRRWLKAPTPLFDALSGANPASKAFDLEITDMDDDSTATAKGYFGAVTSLLGKDPFFKSTGNGYSLYNKMLDSLNLFSRTVYGYTGPDFNIKQYIDYELYCEESGVAPGNCIFPLHDRRMAMKKGREEGREEDEAVGV